MAVARRLAVALVIGVVGVLLLATPVAAQGGCAATANGTDVTTLGSPGDALQVDADDQVALVVTSGGAAFTSYDVQLEFAGVRWSVASGATTGPSWSDVVKVDDYASHGVGIYKVIATSTLQGGDTCSTVAYVEVSGKSPLSTTAGRVAAAGVVLGLAGSGAVALRAAKPAAAYDLDEAVIRRPPEERPFAPAQQRLTSGFCAPLVLVALGLTLQALASDAWHSVLALIGKVQR